jgi:hypothetical protein
MHLHNPNSSNVNKNDMEAESQLSYASCNLSYIPPNIETCIELNNHTFWLKESELILFNESVLCLLNWIRTGKSLSSSKSVEYKIQSSDNSELYTLYLFNQREIQYPILVVVLDRNQFEVDLYIRHASLIERKGFFLLEGIDLPYSTKISADEFINECCNYLDHFHNDLVNNFPGIVNDETYIEIREDINSMRMFFSEK